LSISDSSERLFGVNSESAQFGGNDLDAPLFAMVSIILIGMTTTGQRLDMWWRGSVYCRKLDGKWMISRVHSSVPFDTETGKTSLGLKP